MQIMAEERSLEVLSELARGFMPAKRNQPDAVALRALPLAVIPGTGHDEVRVVGVLLFRMAENLPRPPGVFLIPKAGHIQVRNRGGMELPDPGFFFPEVVVVRVLDRRVPERN